MPRGGARKGAGRKPQPKVPKQARLRFSMRGGARVGAGRKKTDASLTDSEKTAKNRAYHRLRAYGLTQQQHDEIASEQGWVCAICCEGQRVFDVDHDHATGLVRGLLCFKCNSGLGMFRDRPDLLIAAIRYLQVAKRKESA